jgi:hypothetical protein
MAELKRLLVLIGAVLAFLAAAYFVGDVSAPRPTA